LYAGESEILHLSEAGAQETRTPHAVNTFDHVALKCTGLADMESTLKRHAVGFRRSEVPLTGQVQLFFTDPAGNGVELSFAPQDV
jgi:catechol-2,3-dioxygenase